jgi:AraC-like DNA-binding protein
MEEKFVITEINRVVMVGKNEYPEQMLSFGHTVNHNELIFHFSGYSTVYFDDLILETKPNTVRFLPCGTTARYDVLRHERGECIDICFDADRPISPHAFVINVSRNEKLGALFKKLFATWVSKKDGYYFESLSLLYLIFSELQKENTSPSRHAHRIAPALEIIHNNFLSQDLSLKALADACFMSESYFQKLFKTRYGISPKKYIIQLKINHACDLLQTERYTASGVAELCNFSDVYFFSRQFKEYLGITPTQFVKKYRSSK